MSQKKGSGGHYVRAVIACFLALIIVFLGYRLLIFGYLSGGSFVSLFALALVTGFILAQWSRLSELSLLGSSVKLRELTNSAEVAIENAETAIKKLETGRVNIYRTALALAMRHPGGFASEYGDGRTREFVLVADMIKSEGLERELSDDLLKKGAVLLARQYDGLSRFQHPATGLELTGIEPEVMVQKFRLWLKEDGRDYAEDKMVPYITEQIELLSRLIEIKQSAEAARER